MITNWLVDHRWSTTVGLAALVVLGPLVGAWLAGRPRVARWLAVLSLLPVAGLTLAPAWPRVGGSRCAVQWPSLDLGAVEQVANVLLFAVPALLAAVALRRPVPVLLGGSALSAAVEAVQAAAPALGRACDTGDWVANTIGAGLGVLVGWLALTAAGRGTGRARPAAARGGPRPAAR